MKEVSKWPHLPKGVPSTVLPMTSDDVVECLKGAAVISRQMNEAHMARFLTVIAHDKNGREIQEGDIIRNDYGVQTVVFWNEETRSYGARDMAPFPITIREAEIKASFEVIGHIGEQPDFKPIYEAEIYYSQRKLEKELERSKDFLGWLRKLLKGN